MSQEQQTPPTDGMKVALRASNTKAALEVAGGLVDQGLGLLGGLMWVAVICLVAGVAIHALPLPGVVAKGLTIAVMVVVLGGYGLLKAGLVTLDVLAAKQPLQVGVVEVSTSALDPGSPSTWHLSLAPQTDLELEKVELTVTCVSSDSEGNYSELFAETTFESSLLVDLPGQLAAGQKYSSQVTVELPESVAPKEGKQATWYAGVKLHIPGAASWEEKGKLEAIEPA